MRRPRGAAGLICLGREGTDCMADAAEARGWLMENLADPDREHRAGGDYYRVVAAYIVGLPDDDPELARVAGLLNSYDHGPGRRPDISLNGDDEDTADVIGGILDNDETARGFRGRHRLPRRHGAVAREPGTDVLGARDGWGGPATSGRRRRG
jgi:hypothetical protein